MLVEEGGDGPVRGIPDTLQALIAARIDFLPPDCKVLLQRAAVAGRIFWRGAFSALAPELDDPGRALDGLIHRDFVTRESRTTIKGERAYRFKHVLIRDVAYGGLAKSMRADLHARFARWLAEHAGGELLEIRAYHLDQAALLHAELDGAVPAELAHEAAAALEQAGRRGVAREANRSARKLFRRAVELEPTLERRFQAARAAWRLDDLPAVAAEMEVVRAAAAEAGDRAVEGRASTVLAEVALLRDADLPRGRELVEGALELLQDAEPEDRFHALTTRSRIEWWLGNLAADEKYLRRALAVAEEAGRRDLEATATEELASVALSRYDLEQASFLAERALELLAGSSHRVARAWALLQRGRVAMAYGRLDDAEADLREAIELFDEAGAAWGLARANDVAASVAWRSGDTTTAERRFRDAIRLLTPIEDRGALCESQRQLSQLYVELGRVDEAEVLALQARKTVGPHDMASRATTRMAHGLVRAAQGRDEEAERLLREALDVIKTTGIDVRAGGDAEDAGGVPAGARPRRGGGALRGGGRRAVGLPRPPRARRGSPDSTPRRAIRRSRSPGARSARVPPRAARRAACPRRRAGASSRCGSRRRCR